MATKRLNKVHIFIFGALLVMLPFCPVQASVFSAQSVVDLVNKDRAERNIKPLEISGKLSEAAAQKAHDMFDYGYFAHNSPSGVTPWFWIQQSEYDYAYAGENLAINFTEAQSQHTALMKSESHKKNILNVKYQDVGVAVVQGTMDGRQTIITVQEFGTLAGAIPQAAKTFPKVEGAASEKDVPTAAGNQLERTVDFAGAVVGSLVRGAGESLNSQVGGAYSFAVALALAAVFLVFVFLFGHAHSLAHEFSPLRAKIRNIFSNVEEQYPHHSWCNFIDSVHLGKIYLTHMKMRK